MKVSDGPYVYLLVMIWAGSVFLIHNRADIIWVVFEA